MPSDKEVCLFFGSRYPKNCRGCAFKHYHHGVTPAEHHGVDTCAQAYILRRNPGCLVFGGKKATLEGCDFCDFRIEHNGVTPAEAAGMAWLDCNEVPTSLLTHGGDLDSGH